MRTVNGHSAWEVVSALQKAIRRGEMDDALYWATDLDLSGYGNWLWRRLRIICSEDVGPAWPEGPAVIRSLYESWQEEKSRKDGGAGALFIGHAVMALVHAKKTRVVDHAVGVHYLAHTELRREVPDYALDVHTQKGRAMGRTGQAGNDHFYDVAAFVNDEDAEWLEQRQLYGALERKIWDAEEAQTGSLEETERQPQTKAEMPDDEPDEQPEQVQIPGGGT
jgi:replication-associated recombination protein RarA